MPNERFLIEDIERLKQENKELRENSDAKALTMLFGFAGYITSMDKPITFGSNHLATPAADIAAAIAKSNNLLGECDFDLYTSPKESDINGSN